MSGYNTIGSVTYKLWDGHLPYCHTVILTEGQEEIVICNSPIDGTQ